MSPPGPTPTADSDTPRKLEALELFDGLPRRYDELSAALSFWQDPRWRRALVGEVAPRAGQRILDVATGTGMVAAELLRRADCSVVGIDQSEPMLARARARFAGRAESQVRLLRGEAEALPFEDASFDALTFTYLLRYVEDPAATVAELARVVRPGGRVVVLEITTPTRAPLSWFYRVWFDRVVPVLGRLAGTLASRLRRRERSDGPSVSDAYAYLPSSVRRFPGPAELAREMERAGLSEIGWVLTAGGIVAIHAGTVPGGEPR
jgi:demethylmenaquinone methyltransferase/2-methoxy-6-polyprenyl-1,4-benzoquinol methylase